MLLWIACFLLTYLATEPAAAASQSQRAQLRILTYNLPHDGPRSGFFENGTNLKQRLDMTVQELQRLQPSVIAFQEASVSRAHGNVPSGSPMRSDTS